MLRLDSTAFAGGQTIPARFTCDGADAPPPLAWSGAPPGTRSFALVCADPDAPGRTFYHWTIFDLPADCAGLPGRGGHEAVNDFGRHGYGGPCPPRGHPPHRYRFRLYALDVPRLALARGADCREVERLAERHALAHADLEARYGRPGAHDRS